jgi:hypothetical protein
VLQIYCLEPYTVNERVHHGAKASSECVKNRPFIQGVPLEVANAVASTRNGVAGSVYDGNAYDQIAWENEHKAQAVLLRCIFGNPFRPITLHPAWLTPTIASLAQAIYGDRQLPSGLFDNQRMGVLADALEEAGCDNAEVLSHLRGGGEHVRGCWVVDAVLGK